MTLPVETLSPRWKVSLQLTENLLRFKTKCTQVGVLSHLHHHGVLSFLKSKLFKDFYSDCVCVQGGRWRWRQSGRWQQPARYHLYRLQDVSEHCGQRQGRKHSHGAAVHFLYVEGQKISRWQLSETCFVAHDELMARSCFCATGSPMQLQWVDAGTECVLVAERLCLYLFVGQFEYIGCTENQLCKIHAP